MRLNVRQLDERIVPATADFNHDGIVDQVDYLHFREAYNNGPSDADLNASGQVDQADFVVFRSQYGTGTAGIYFDDTSGAVTILVNAYKNTVLIQPSAFDPAVINVSVGCTDANNNNVLNLSRAIPLDQLHAIRFYGQGGTLTSVTNNTAVPMLAYGSQGTTSIQGGSGDDTLYAGSGETTLRGMAGDDMLYGGPNNNYMYGGAGDDAIIPGPGPGLNFIFPD